MAANPAFTFQEVCPNCGDFTSSLSQVTGWCKGCSPADSLDNQLNEWLATNADAIEHYMLQGNSLTKSIDLAARRVRPICAVCSKEISHGSKSSVFCRKNRECRRYSRRYIYLYTRRGMTKAQALAQVLSELEA